MSDTEAEAQARTIYHQFQADHLAATPLAGIGDWVASGDPPSVAELQAAGFSGAEVENAESLRFARKAFVRDWGFAIPCREAVGALRKLGPLLEIGAGSGYWSAMLAAAGHDVVATDIGAGVTRYGTEVGSRAPFVRLSAADAVLAYPERDVFCSWPAAGEGWITDALELTGPGRAMALVLDDRPGITGDESLRAFLNDRCEPIGDVAIPQFPGVRDRLLLFRRRWATPGAQVSISRTTPAVDPDSDNNCSAVSLARQSERDTKTTAPPPGRTIATGL